MIDVEHASNAELDEITLASDEQQGQRMLRQVYHFLGRFVAYPSEHARVAHALWIVHTHMMDRWDITPRIAFLSAEPESGKTRALEVSRFLVPRPMQTVNISPAALFRCVQSPDGTPTLLYDEIDTVFGAKAKENEDVRGLLNAGYERGAKTYRCLVRGNGQVELEGIEAYCAVALAGGLRQYGVKSRTIRVGDTTPRGYRREDLFDAWERYLPPPPDGSATCATAATVVPFPAQAQAGVADVADLSGHGGEACGQCGQPGELMECAIDGRTHHVHRECQNLLIAAQG